MLDVAVTILASITFNLSLALQAVDTRSSSTSLSFRPSLLFYLLRQPLWLAGSFLGLVAVALQLYALSRLPLSFVQTVIAAGVLVLPVAARLLLKEPLSVRILLASVVVVGGVAALSAGLPGETAHVPPVAPPLLLGAAVLGMAVFLLLRGLNDPRLLCLVAGCGYGIGGILSKLLVSSAGVPTLAAIVLALVCFGAMGFLAEQSALQTLSPTRTAPIILALMTVLPVLAGRLLLGEQWPHPALNLVGIALTLLPAIWISARVTLRSPRGAAPALD